MMLNRPPDDPKPLEEVRREPATSAAPVIIY